MTQDLHISNNNPTWHIVANNDWENPQENRNEETQTCHNDSSHSDSTYGKSHSENNVGTSQNSSTVANSVSFRFSINDKLHNATEGGGANV